MINQTLYYILRAIFINLVLTISLFIFAMCASAEGYHLLDLRRATIETWKNQTYYNPYMPYYVPYADDSSGAEKWLYGAAFNPDIDLYSYGWLQLTWENHVYLNATQNQVREAGWQWDLKMIFDDKYALKYHHHSVHHLDAPGYTPAYPLRDQIGLEITLYERAD